MTFFAWLCGLDQAELGRIIANRPEIALLASPPRDRADLAARLQNEATIGVYYVTASRPIHDVVDMMVASGGHSTIDALAKSLDVAVDDPDLLAAVEWLTTRGLAWPDPQGLHLMPAFQQLVPRPYRLGRPARAMLEATTVPVLSAITLQWGLRAERTKARLVATMTDWLSVGENVRKLLRTAPADIRAEIERLAWEGPVTAALHTPAVRWALEHGLVYSSYWSGAEMPAEVGRALRGPDWRPTFTPRPPQPTTVAVAPGMARRESAAAAMAMLEQVAALTAECARKPVPSLKNGGIGVRELRRLAKTVGCDEHSVRLWLDLAFEASLLDLEADPADDARLFATAEYDAWLAEEPAARLTRLLIAWLQSTTEPYTDAMARVPALVESEDANPMLALVRRELLTAANRLPSDRGLVSDDGLAAVIAWQMPGLRMEDAMLTSLWREARAMGIVAHGTLTPLGRALATADEDQLIDAARDLVGTPTTSAIFQADLTAVVPGIPAYTLASLLDSAADRESRGGALIWRFSSASVRRALDAGIAAEELTTQLTGVSSGGVIPQPLAYLIGDIGRRHGGVRVRDVGCVIHGLDEALLTEILSVKALRKLGLTRLAPTVLAAASPQGETLDALRAAGYLPAAEQADGNPHLPSTVQQRASTAPQLPFTSAALDPAGQPDPYDLARQLCGRPPGKEPRYRAQPPGLPFGLIDPNEIPFGFDDGDDDPGGYPGSEEHALLHHAIEEYADSLDPKGVCQLATAIEFGEPVRVTYRPIGSRTKLRAVVELETIDGEHVRGRDLISGRPVKLQLGAIERIHQV